ncbi:MAG: DsbE family thiol:disulfide interchange protein [Woeseiaceae bacterium]|nr:DsbE family thiol:disulfide interchange protein [Woeseiaceae bacterium]
MNRYLIPLFVMIAMISFLLLGLGDGRDPSKLPSQYIGKPAPDFNLPMLTDLSRTLSTSTLKGQVSLVNIWATWCVGCRVEHGFLMELANSETIPIYAINWRDNRSDALNFLGQLGNPYIASGFDRDGRVGIDWGVYGAPETFLINNKGIVVYRFTGPLNRIFWEQEFVPRIAEIEN